MALFSGQAADDPLRQFTRAQSRLRAASDASVVQLAATLPQLVGGAPGVRRLLVQWLASRVRHNDLPPAILGWLDAHAAPVPTEQTATSSASSGLLPEAVVSHALSFADQRSLLAASHTCSAWAVAGRLPAARTELAIPWGQGLDALEAHLASRTKDGATPCFVPFLRVSHLRVGRRWRALPGPLPPLPFCRRLLGSLGSLTHVHVQAPEAWAALSPQRDLTHVFVDLDEGPVTADAVCRVATRPERVAKVGGNLALPTSSASVWARLSHLRALRLERPREARLPTGAAPFVRVWPRLSRLAIGSADAERPALSRAVHTFVASVVGARKGGTVTVAFKHRVPHPSSFPPSRTFLHLAALHVERASTALGWWLRRLRVKRVVVRSWDASARASPIHMLQLLSQHHGAEEVVLHHAEDVLRGGPARFGPIQTVRKAKLTVLRVRLLVATLLSRAQMQNVDVLAQCAAWTGLATVVFADGQEGVDAAVLRLRQRLSHHAVTRPKGESPLIECRRM